MKTKTRTVALEAKVASLRAAGAFAAEGIEVDEANGVIKNCAVMTIGPADGHGFSIDTTTLEQLSALIAQHPGGVPMRFTHPTQSDSGIVETLGTDVGYLRNARVVGNSVRGDVHLGEWSKSLPVLGNVWAYLISKAKNDPTGFGLSAVIAIDIEPVMDASGKAVGLFARINQCLAVDFVGTPAANPNGLLSKNESKADQIKRIGLATDAERAKDIANAMSVLRAYGYRVSLTSTKPSRSAKATPKS